VVSASSANVIATIIPGGGINLSDPVQASFDGERILVTNPGDNSIALFKAADLSYVGTISFGGTPYGACSDGINFWVTFIGTHFLVRF
jgi:DNA-binding beta-propeller fold protein YncE